MCCRLVPFTSRNIKHEVLSRLQGYCELVGTEWRSSRKCLFTRDSHIPRHCTAGEDESAAAEQAVKRARQQGAKGASGAVFDALEAAEAQHSRQQQGSLPSMWPFADPVPFYTSFCRGDIKTARHMSCVEQSIDLISASLDIIA